MFMVFYKGVFFKDLDKIKLVDWFLDSMLNCFYNKVIIDMFVGILILF